MEQALGEIERGIKHLPSVVHLRKLHIRMRPSSILNKKEQILQILY